MVTNLFSNNIVVVFQKYIQHEDSSTKTIGWNRNSNKVKIALSSLLFDVVQI